MRLAVRVTEMDAETSDATAMLGTSHKAALSIDECTAVHHFFVKFSDTSAAMSDLLTVEPAWRT